mmetsp:Transcript_71550/g.124264  ORF Transcript_71550/g.124264 Transcript_71550/m.124264 type:complete len:96 (+) Transcript_71550:183-470(+)
MSLARAVAALCKACSFAARDAQLQVVIAGRGLLRILELLYLLPPPFLEKASLLGRQAVTLGQQAPLLLFINAAADNAGGKKAKLRQDDEDQQQLR